MITDELKFRIRSALVHTPTAEQENAIDVFSMFMTDRHEQTVMILRGSAGTGKTTLAASIVKALLSLQQKMVLMLKETIGQSLTSTKYQMMSMTSQMRKTRKS